MDIPDEIADSLSKANYRPSARYVSPDGKWLAFYTGSAGNPVDMPASGTFDLTLNLLDLSTGEEQPITPLLSKDYPNNFVTAAAQLNDPDITAEYLYQAFVHGITRALAWSADGRYLAFAGQMDGLSSDLYLYDVETKTIRRLSSGDQELQWIDWSPDGKWIAFFSDASGEYQLQLQNQTGRAEAKFLAPGEPPSFYYKPQWSPDSRKVLYTDKRMNLWYMDIQDGKNTKVDTDLYDHPIRALNPVWSPDSRELLFSRGDERHMRLLRRPLNGGPVQTVLYSEGPKFPSDWSSDGRFLAFSSQWPDYHHMHIWAMQVNGGGDVLFNEAPTAETIRTIVAAHRRFGTTSLLPTLISDTDEKMRAARDLFVQRMPGIEADGGIRLSPYDATDGTRYRIVRSYRLPLSSTPGAVGGFHEAYRIGATAFYGVPNDRAIGADIGRRVVDHRHAGISAGVDRCRRPSEIALSHFDHRSGQRRHHR